MRLDRLTETKSCGALEGMLNTLDFILYWKLLGWFATFYISLACAFLTTPSTCKSSRLQKFRRYPHFSWVLTPTLCLDWPQSQDLTFPQKGKDTGKGTCQASKKERECHMGALRITLTTGRGVVVKKSNKRTVTNLDRTSLNLSLEPAPWYQVLMQIQKVWCRYQFLVPWGEKLLQIKWYTINCKVQPNFSNVKM